MPEGFEDIRASVKDGAIGSQNQHINQVFHVAARAHYLDILTLQSRFATKLIPVF